MKNYYEILEVHPRASKEVIEKAYRVLVKKYHPDLYIGEEKIYAEQKIRDVNEAYKILSDVFLKEQYDLELEKEKKYKNSYSKQVNSKNKEEKKVNAGHIEKKQRHYKQEENTYKVGTLMSLMDLLGGTFKKIKNRKKRKLQKEDFIAGGIAVGIVVVLIVVLWFIPATNGFVRSLVPILN